MPATTKAPKGLPKRCRNENRKARRKRSWERGQERKRRRREENDARHRANVERGYREYDRHEEERARRRRADGREPVARTAVGNIIRPDGRVEACCRSRKWPCVHYLREKGVVRSGEAAPE